MNSTTFSSFDEDGNGIVTSANLRFVYNCSQYPKVISEGMKLLEIFVESLASFGDRNGHEIITKEEWNDYYADTSYRIDKNDKVGLLVRNAWELD